jgi:hypothetical protein
MNMEQSPTPETKKPIEATDDSDVEVSEAVLRNAQQDMGQVILFRVMNLEGHSGVSEDNGEGRYVYTVDSRQYQDQGDFAFSGAKAFDSAVTRAYPNALSRVHAIRATKEDVVVPYPDEAPELVYVRNGATVEAVRVPREIVDQHVEKSTAEKDDPQSTEDVKQKLFGQ